MKLINDTLKPKGKYELKRIASLTAFYVAVLYAFMPVFIREFAVHEFVFWGFITFSASCIGMQVWNKKVDNRRERFEDTLDDNGDCQEPIRPPQL